VVAKGPCQSHQIPFGAQLLGCQNTEMRTSNDNLTHPNIDCTDFDRALQEYRPMAVETLLPTEARVSGGPR